MAEKVGDEFKTIGVTTGRLSKALSEISKEEFYKESLGKPFEVEPMTADDYGHLPLKYDEHLIKKFDE